jgi:gentisate 1,2-dioxygenase
MLWPITLNNNQTFHVRWCGAADGVLWIDGLDMTLAEAVALFSDTAKTSHIVAYDSVEHDGYTQLIHLSLSEGLVKVALRKEA